MIIGLIGYKGSGKDTLADYLVKKHNFVKYNFSNPIKEISKIMFNLDDKDINDKETIIDEYNLSPRIIFQRLGTEFGQYMIYELFPELKTKIKKRTFWLKHFTHFLNKNKGKNIVIADVRFIHEFQYLEELNCIFIRIIKNKIKNDKHISENELNNIIKNQYILNNNETISDLESNFEKLNLFNN